MDYCIYIIKWGGQWVLALLMILAFTGVVNGQTTIYSEDFTGQDGKGAIGGSPAITIDTADVDWAVDTTNIALTASSDYFKVVSGVFVGKDIDGTQQTNGGGKGAVWSSPEIDINGYSEISISVDVGNNGGGFESPDFVKAYYSIDGADTTQFGKLFGDFTATTFTVKGLSGSTLSIYVEVDNNAGTEEITFDNVLVEEVIIKAEPSNHVSAFSGTGSIKSLNFSWTDVSSSPTVDGYLIKGSTTDLSSVSSPVDGTAESDDTDFSDGSVALNVLQGNESASITGLEETTTYYFKIFPYTNSGSDIDYKTDGSVPSSTVTTLNTPDIVINEIHADPDATTGDANGDGTVNTSSDEFIEIVNHGTTNIDITNWTLKEGAGNGITFPATTILKAGQALVLFDGGTPTGDFGGALTFTSSLGLNNTGDDVILKNASSVTVVSYTYGSEGGDNQSITRDPDITGSFVKHSTTASGTNFSPGTQTDGTPFYSFETDLTGSQGFRLLSAPTESSFTDLLSPLWTQGATTASGADTDQGNPNVFTWDTSTDSWSGLTALDGNVAAGTGFLMHVYADDNYDGSNDAFPKTIGVIGSENSADASPTLNSSADGFTLVGNPFSSTIDFDNVTTNELTGVIYVWDPNSEAGNGGKNGETASGSWKTWNGITGDITDGLIAPFQGFFVENAASVTSPSVTFGAASKSSGGSLLGKTTNESPLAVRLELSDESISNSLWLSFNEEGTLQSRANGDALELEPMSDNFVQLASRKADVLYDIAALPIPTGESYTLPIHLKASKTGAFTLKATDFNIPENFNLVFHDYEQGIEEVITKNFTYQIEIATAAKVAGGSILERVAIGNVALKATTASSERYGIAVEPNETTSNEGVKNNLPEQITLKQNYPNPFNPGTTIAFDLTEATQVQLNVYNMLGQKVGELLNETRSAGSHNVYFDASSLTSGVYYYEMIVDGQRMTRKMTLLK